MYLPAGCSRHEDQQLRRPCCRNIHDNLSASRLRCTKNLRSWIWANYLFVKNSNVKKGKGRYSSSWLPHLRATGRHLPYGITQCYLPPDTSERAPPNPNHIGWYSIYLPGGMEGWVDLVDLIAPRPGVEPATFRSRVRRRTVAPPRHRRGWRQWYPPQRLCIWFLYWLHKTLQVEFLSYVTLCLCCYSDLVTWFPVSSSPMRCNAGAIISLLYAWTNSVNTKKILWLLTDDNWTSGRRRRRMRCKQSWRHLNVITQMQPSRCICRPSYHNRLAVPSVKLALGSLSFSGSGPTVWNALPDYLRIPPFPLMFSNVI